MSWLMNPRALCKVCVNRARFCRFIPTEPNPNLGRILVTGASGYIGGRLFPELLIRGYQVRIMVREDSPVFRNLWPDVEVVVADALNPDQLKHALDGIDTAYYLIHSLHLGPETFSTADIKAAANFREMAERQGVKRMIYLGGLGDVKSPLSAHLRSRIEVAEELKKGSVSTTILRAAIIIGSGSASYEIIQHLAKNLSVILIPRWAKNKCQPIGVRDVIKYLVGVLETPETEGKDFDIGGKQTLTYEQMIKILARLFRRKVLFVPFPFSMIRVFAYLTSLVTPVPNAITQCLMEGLSHDVVCREQSIKDFLAFEPSSYKMSLCRALRREEQDAVYTRWSDAYPSAWEFALKLDRFKDRPLYTACYQLVTKNKSSSLFDSICRIGGKKGWFRNNWLWRLRGTIDKILLGVGTLRGRKSHSHLHVNDVIDFWRVEDLEPDRRLLLRAEMKIPGRAWLEFNIEEKENDFRKLSLVAYYYSSNIFGKIYWYLCLPFHEYIFRKLIQDIDKRSQGVVISRS